MVNNNTGILPQEIRMHDMEKIYSKLRRTDYYDFGHGLMLMNVLSKTEEGKLDRIDTYIGVEGNEFVCVGCAKDLSAPGVIFSYGEYVRFQRANKATYYVQHSEECKCISEICQIINGKFPKRGGISFLPVTTVPQHSGTFRYATRR